MAVSLFRKSEDIIEKKLAEETVEPEEWIWVDGYKATDRNMRCRDFQYELGKKYDMPNDVKVEACESGFHLCLYLSDVFNFYSIGNGHRYFLVRALVRKKDADEYTGRDRYSYLSRNDKMVDKLAAKSIEFIRELDMDEILKGSRAEQWPEQYRRMALNTSIGHAGNLMYVDNLKSVGYSEPLANMLSSSDRAYELAYAFGSQSDMSMDMKMYCLMTSIYDKKR